MCKWKPLKEAKLTIHRMSIFLFVLFCFVENELQKVLFYLKPEGSMCLCMPMVKCNINGCVCMSVRVCVCMLRKCFCYCAADVCETHRKNYKRKERTNEIEKEMRDQSDNKSKSYRHVLNTEHCPFLFIIYFWFSSSLFSYTYIVKFIMRTIRIEHGNWQHQKCSKHPIIERIPAQMVGSMYGFVLWFWLC